MLFRGFTQVKLMLLINLKHFKFEKMYEYYTYFLFAYIYFLNDFLHKYLLLGCELIQLQMYVLYTYCIFDCITRNPH